VNEITSVLQLVVAVVHVFADREGYDGLDRMWVGTDTHRGLGQKARRLCWIGSSRMDPRPTLV